MKAFLVGLLFLAAVGVFAGLCFLLLPLFLVLGILLRICLVLVLAIGAVWLLGKVIIFVWGKIKGPRCG